jgi:hypothetical protein
MNAAHSSARLVGKPDKWFLARFHLSDFGSVNQAVRTYWRHFPPRDRLTLPLTFWT